MTSKLLKVIRHPLKTIKLVNRRYFQFGASVQDPHARFMLGWMYGNLPRQELTEVFPGIQTQRIELPKIFDRTHNMSLTVYEVNVLAAIIKHLHCRKVVEIGTFDGGSTLNIAANLPDEGVVFTVDLPTDATANAIEISSFNDNKIDGHVVGQQFHGSEYAGRIRQILKDSAELTSDDVGDDVDLSFIDGCHDKAYVVKDTENALNYLKPDGVVIWHDYGMIEDVAEVLDSMTLPLELHAIAGTRLVVGLRHS